MTLYERTIQKIRENKERRLRGDIIALPWNLPRLSRILPGVEPETITLISSGPKAGKSQLANYLYMFQPIDYLYTHPDCNLDIKIFYFSLEISQEAIMRQAISYRLFTKHGISVSPQKLLSVFGSYILDDHIEALIKQEEPWIKFFESKIDIQDSIRNPTGIYLYMKSWYEANGSWAKKTIIYDEKEVEIKDYYIPKNQNLITIGIVDHISLLSAEKADGLTMNLHQAIGKFSSEYCLRLRDKYKACMCIVQQQALASEQQQFTNSGKSIVEKLKPSADGLGDNKLTSRDCNLMLGIFNPYKYGFATYKASGETGYNLERLQDNHRELIILLNRNGISSAAIDLYFNGASSYFQELPRPESIQEDDYVAIELQRSKVV
jgi:hypothetical protein